MTGRHGLGALIAAAAIAVAACSGSGSTPIPATPAAPAASPTAAVSSPAAAPSDAPSAAPSAAPSSAAAACQVGDATAAVSTQIKDFAFESGLTVKAGEAISFSNGDSAPHTVTMDDGTCDTGRIEPGASATVTFSAPGTYSFHCTIHPSMKASVVVSG